MSTKVTMADNRTSLRQSVKEIDPALAAKWLEKNETNRSIKKTWVAYLAHEMKQGRWQLSGTPIIFSPAGRLIDGQHRLLAVIEAGVTIRNAVVMDAPDSIFHVVDTNQVRSAADILGIRGDKFPRATAAVANLLYRYENGLMSFGALRTGIAGDDGKRKALRTALSKAEIMAIVDAHPGIDRSVFATKRVQRLISPSLAATLHYLFAKKDETLADLFFATLESGANLNETDPVHVLREKYLESKLNPVRQLRPSIQMALAIKAWNLMREGKSCRRLIVTANEEFPKVK